MAANTARYIRRRYLFVFAALLLMAAFAGMFIGNAQASGAKIEAQAPAISNNSDTSQIQRPIVPNSDALLILVPQGSAPPNGGSVTVGARFVLELWLNAGSHVDTTAQQSYLTYTQAFIQNANVSQIATSCVPTNTVTLDNTTFDAQLQNEVCNGPGNCTFRGLVVAPGSLAFASGALSNCPDGCGGFFRVAQTGWCAVSAGQARLHWQFAPPAPLTRDTDVSDARCNRS